MASKAPELKVCGEKNIDFTKRGKAIRTHDLEEAIMNGLGGRDMVALKVMFYLTGCGEGYRIVEKTICNSCNITHANYQLARQKLVDMGWIIHEPGGHIIVNYYEILKKYCNNEKSDCNDTSKGYCNDTHNNIINNISNSISSTTNTGYRKNELRF